MHLGNVLPYVADRQAAIDAAHLIDEHGDAAFAEAAARADRSRDRGNVIHFCRWRQIARLIRVMTEGEGPQTRH